MSDLLVREFDIQKPGKYTAGRKSTGVRRDIMSLNKLRLSRRERTARTKIIQENHYNRKEQRRLDRYVEQHHITYNWVYTRIKGGAFLAFMAENGVERIAAAFLKASAQSATVSDAFEKMAKAIRALRAADQRLSIWLVQSKERRKKEYEKNERKETDDEAAAESFARRS